MICAKDADEDPNLTEVVKQEHAKTPQAVRDADISPNTSAVEIATDDSNPGQVFVRHGDDVGDAAQNVASSVVPHQYAWVSHAGDLITGIGVLVSSRG
jgi:hypothetical protein